MVLGGEAVELGISAAAEAGIERIERRLALWEAGQNVWYGISLGSVLFLAAIGLAITFGVRWRSAISCSDGLRGIDSAATRETKAPAMSLAKAKPRTAGYEEDFHRWAVEQAAALEEERWPDLDWDNVAEEIESLGRNNRRALETHLEILIAHLLKCLVQPERRTRSWDLTIAEQRRRITRLIRRHPTLRNVPEAHFSDAYVEGRWMAARDTGLEERSFPASPPFTLKEVLDPSFFPGGGGSGDR